MSPPEEGASERLFSSPQTSWSITVHLQRSSLPSGAFHLLSPSLGSRLPFPKVRTESGGDTAVPPHLLAPPHLRPRHKHASKVQRSQLHKSTFESTATLERCRSYLQNDNVFIKTGCQECDHKVGGFSWMDSHIKDVLQIISWSLNWSSGARQ